MDDFTAARAAKASKEKFEVLLKDFDPAFTKLFEDAKKGSFANTKSGEMSTDSDGSRMFNTNVTIGGKMVTLGYGEEDVMYAIMVFTCPEGEGGGKEYCAQLEASISKLVPETYKMAKDFNPDYRSSKYANIWEHTAEKFAEVAKKPSVSLTSHSGMVVVKIMEPVFKR